jgi:MYXO-CTERM domain-containing protein
MDANVSLELHPVLKESADAAVRTASYDGSTGTFTVPARTTAVFMGRRTPVTQPGPGPGEGGDTSCGCSGAGSAAFSAFALLLGLGVLRRSRRREQ